MSKSLIYVANNTSQAIAVGQNINFGSIVRRYGSNCMLSGGNVAVEGQGYYDIDANVSFQAGAAGTATFTMYADGVAIPGAVATMTVASGSTYSVSIPAIIRTFCCNASFITVAVTGVAGTVTNAAMAVRKD